VRLTLVNGSRELQISPWDRGFLYGDGCFETLRTYAGRLFALELHLERLQQGAIALGIDAASSISALRREAVALVAEAGPGEWQLRLLLTRGEGAGAALVASGEPTRVVLLEPLVVPPESAYAQGVRAETLQAPGGTLGPKTLAYLPHLLALQRARAAGLAEVIFRDERGGLGQGSTCNVLCCRGTTLIAPLPAGGRAGVTRHLLLAGAEGLGLRVEEGEIWPEEAAAGDELLLCSTLREVLPVVVLDGQPVGRGVPGPLAAELRRALQRWASE